MGCRWALVRLRLRSEIRRRAGGFVLLIVVIAFSGGVAMAAAAGARRSATSYDRFRSWAHDTDVSFAGCDCSPTEFTRASTGSLRRHSSSTAPGSVRQQPSVVSAFRGPPPPTCLTLWLTGRESIDAAAADVAVDVAR